MKFRRRILTLVLMCLVVVSTMSVAFAATTGPISATPITFALTDWTKDLDFAQFDSALGTLYKVDLSVSMGITSTLTVTNGGTSTSSGSAYTHLLVNVRDPLGLLTLNPDMFTSPAVEYSLAPSESAIFSGLTGSDTQFGSYTNSAILAEFVGSGTISMGATTTTKTLLENTGGNTDASQVTLANATGTVTYWYDPVEVPEFSSVILALMGMTGVGTLRRFRKQR